MRKSVVVLFFSVLILTIFLVVAYFLSTKKNTISSYQIFSVAKAPNNYPKIAWNDITSGKLLNYLEIQDRNGKLPLISSAAKPITMPAITTPEFFEANGLTILQVAADDVASNKYKNSETRPFRFVGFFKKELGGTAYLVLVQKWLNQDGSTVFLPLVVPESLAIINNSISSYYDELTTDNTVYFLGPILQIKNLTQCKFALPKRETYCDWYFQDQNISNTLLNMVTEWTKFGNILKEVGKTPMVFSVSRLFKN
jgi:hypothetical protein